MKNSLKFIIAAVIIIGISLFGVLNFNQTSPVIPESQLTVKNLGSDPKLPLRYHLEVGKKQNAKMRMLMNLKITFEGMPTPQNINMPWISTPVSAEIVDFKDGFYHVNAVIGEMQVEEDSLTPPNILSGLKAQLAQFKLGGTCSYKLNSLGEMKDLSCKIDNNNPQLKQMIDQVMASMKQCVLRLPEQAVGVGAEFSLNSAITTTMTVDQNINLTLTKATSEAFSLNVSITQSAKPQSLTIPGVPKELDSKLLNYDASGTGNMEIFPNKPLFPKSNLNLNSKWKMQMNKTPESKDAPMEINYEMQVSMEVIPTA